jgi:hypothetical protein
LERGVGTQAGVDLGESVRAGEDRDESIVELLDGRVLNGLLPDVDVLLNGW